MLTSRQRELLNFLIAEEARGNSPSFDEMCKALGLASKSNAFLLLEKLEERGFIRRDHHRARSIRVVDNSEYARGIADGIADGICGAFKAMGITPSAEDIRKAEFLAKRSNKSSAMPTMAAIAGEVRP